jgi:hypothetical protein
MCGAQLRPADAASGDIAADIARPHHQQHEHQGKPAILRVEAHQHRGQLRRGRIDEACGGPAAVTGCERDDHDKPKPEDDDGDIDQAERETYAGDGQQQRPGHGDADRADFADHHQPFDIKTDRRHRHEHGPEYAAGIGCRQGERCQHESCGNAQQEIVLRPLGVGSACDVGFAHDAVFVTRPPKRRSRRPNSAIAPSSAALSKSGQ